MPLAAPPRRSARIILLDEDDRILLIRFSVVRDGAPFAFLATPGGGVEPGEIDLQAAERELIEELGISPCLRGPVDVATAEFRHYNVLVRAIGVFFAARCEAVAPKLRPHTEAERDAMRCKVVECQ